MTSPARSTSLPAPSHVLQPVSETMPIIRAKTPMMPSVRHVLFKSLFCIVFVSKFAVTGQSPVTAREGGGQFGTHAAVCIFSDADWFDEQIMIQL